MLLLTHSWACKGCCKGGLSQQTVASGRHSGYIIRWVVCQCKPPHSSSRQYCSGGAGVGALLLAKANHCDPTGVMIGLSLLQVCCHVITLAVAAAKRHGVLMLAEDGTPSTCHQPRTNVQKPPGVHQPLLCSPLGCLLLLLLLHLGCLSSHLAGTCQRAVHLACADAFTMSGSEWSTG